MSTFFLINMLVVSFLFFSRLYLVYLLGKNYFIKYKNKFLESEQLKKMVSDTRDFFFKRIDEEEVPVDKSNQKSKNTKKLKIEPAISPK